MDAVYERTMDRVSLILKDSSAGESAGFETKMVCVGGVSGLLPMSVRQMNGETAYVYDVTARQPLSEYIKARPLERAELAEILETVLGILEGLENYLLDADRLLFSADRIFMQGSCRNLRFCYVPTKSQPMREGFYGLVMELIAGADQKDREAIVLGYRFAHELQEANASYGDLRSCLHGQTNEAESREGYGGSTAQKALRGFAGEPVQSGLRDPEEESSGKEYSSFGGKFAQSAPGNAAWSDLGSPGGDSFSGFSDAAAANPGEMSWKEYEEEGRYGASSYLSGASGSLSASSRTLKARLGINRRTIFIVAIGGAVLLTAYLAMHTELTKNLLAAVQANPLIAGGTLLALAAAAAVVLFLRRKSFDKAPEPAGAYAGAASFAGTGSGRTAGTTAFARSGSEPLPSGMRAFAGNSGEDAQSRAFAGNGGEAATSRAFAGNGSGAFSSGKRAFTGNGVEAVPSGMRAFAGKASETALGKNTFAGKESETTRFGKHAFAGNGSGAVPSGMRAFAQGTASDSARYDVRPAAFAASERTFFDEGDLATSMLAPRKEAAAARLRPVTGAEIFEEILLRKDDTLIGKQPDLADAVIPSPVISRIHAHVSRRGDSWTIMDLNSRNGTAVNNTLLEAMRQTRIQNGDIIRFANLEYVFET